jgi:dienelactone hydrolase
MADKHAKNEGHVGEELIMRRAAFDRDAEAIAYSSTAFRARRRLVLYDLLGELPARQRVVTGRTLAVDDREGYVVERLELDLNGLEPVPAVLLKPARVTGGSLPLVIYHHAHWDDYATGKEEVLLGRPAMQSPPYGVALVNSGRAVLALDHWCFGERRRNSESALFKQMLWQGQVLWGAMVYDGLKALDYACARPDLDASRIAVMGMSMGATMSWWTAALDERIKVCVDLSCMTDFDELIADNGLDRHGIYYYVPNLLSEFTTAHINALIAPRPHLTAVGTKDPLTPPRGVDRIDAAMKAVYAAHGRPTAWRLHRYDVGHEETADMRHEVLRFLDEWL